MSFDTQEVTVRRIAEEAERIKSFELVPKDGGTIRPFTPGGHIVVHMPDGMARHYSLTNAPGESDAYRIGVLKELEGRGGSAFMHERVSEGQSLTISGPENNFPLDPAAAHSLLIAGGIGVTPLLAMAQQLHAEGQSFELHYCAKSKAQAAYAGWLEAAPFADKVRFHYDGGDPAQGLDIAALVAGQSADTQIYFCGPAGLMKAIEAAVADWDPARVHSESFAGVDAIGDNAASFEIEIASTGAVFLVPEDKSILTVLRENGFDIDSVCEEGVCGTCIVDLLDGVPEHRDEILSDEEREDNAMLTTCCSRAVSPRLVLDL